MWNNIRCLSYLDVEKADRLRQYIIINISEISSLMSYIIKILIFQFLKSYILKIYKCIKFNLQSHIFHFWNHNLLLLECSSSCLQWFLKQTAVQSPKMGYWSCQIQRDWCYCNFSCYNLHGNFALDSQSLISRAFKHL